MARGMTLELGGDSTSYNAPPQRPRGSISSVYDAAATSQAQDYDDIMSGYDSLQSRARGGTTPQLSFSPLSAIASTNLPNYSYNRSSDLNSAIGGLQEFSRTGGYSDSDVSNIRARGLSPIRAVYENARRNLDRQKVLQGGYSPNYGAVLSKMAREQSSLASDASTDVNARIAQMVQSGKLAGYQSLSPLVSRDSELANAANTRNVDAARELDTSNTGDARNVRDANAQLKMRVDEMNQNNQMDDRNLELSALSGKSNLYGTTPALTNMFGNQVLQNNQQEMQAVQTANQIKNQRAGIGLNLVGAAQKAPAGYRSW